MLNDTMASPILQLRARLPKGHRQTLALQCGCSPQMVSKVLSGAYVTSDLALGILEAAKRMADDLDARRAAALTPTA
jgi:hypothetical protein